MSSPQQRMLAPQYVLQFSCIGPECEDTCCQGWRVFVDQTTYRTYRRLRHLELRPLLDKAVKRNRSNPTPQHYAKIVMDEKGKCPLLSPEGLCRVHAELGEEYLCTVCAVYPRINHMVDGVLERSLTMSCPEAARLALLNPQPMEFQLVLEPMRDRDIGADILDTTAHQFGRRLERHFWDVRSFSIELLQDRSYDVWERLVLLGLFIQKLEQLQSDNPQAIPGLVEEYRRAFADGSLRPSLANIPPQPIIQFKLAKELLDERSRQSITNKQYLTCLAQFLAGLQITKEATVEKIGERYKLAYEEYYLPFMVEHEYIFENYLVNHVFKNCFPLGNRGPFGEYVMLVIHYGLIKMHLIGMAAYHKGLTEELVIKLIYSFSRVIEHNSAYLTRIYQLLEQSGLATMPYMAILIKN